MTYAIKPLLIITNRGIYRMLSSLILSMALSASPAELVESPQIETLQVGKENRRDTRIGKENRRDTRIGKENRRDTRIGKENRRDTRIGKENRRDTRI